MAFSYSHNRQYGIDEVVLLCIGKTNSPDSSLPRNQHQVSRLVPDYEYPVIPIYNLEWYGCVNETLLELWGTYTVGDTTMPRVTCRPRIGSNPRIATKGFRYGYEESSLLGHYDYGSRAELDYCHEDIPAAHNLGTLGQCFPGNRSDGGSCGGEHDYGVHCDSQPPFGESSGPPIVRWGRTGWPFSDITMGATYFILNNGLIFTIHDPAWADKEITVVLVSAKNQRKLYGDTYWFQFADTTFDDYAAGETDYRIGGHNRGLSQDDAAFYGYKDTDNPDGTSDWFRYRNIGSWAAKDTQYGGYSEGGSSQRSYYSQIFKTLVSKSRTGTGGNVNAQGDITIVQEGGSDDTCTPAGNGTITASTTRQGGAPYSEDICQPAVEGDPSCDTSTLQQGSTSLEVETACRNVMYITEEENITPNPLTVDGALSNITDVNFISATGDDSYVVTYAGTASDGMTVGQHLVSRTSRDPKDDKTVGFHVDYKDENDVVDATTEQKKDRMFISAYDNEATAAGALTIMRSTDPGFVGINDIAGQAELILPETIFNVQSTGDAVTRITSINAAHKASVQLSNPDNNLREGFEIEYSNSTARADMSMFNNTGKKTVISIDRESKKIGLHTVTPNELLTLSRGTSDSTGAATISIEEQALDPTHTADYGKVYVKPVEDNDLQTQSLYFKDGTGNVFDLIFDPSSDYRMVYTDDSCNTYVGKTPDRRDDITSSDNTGLGGGALYDITTGDRNTAVGCDAGMNVTTGSYNLFLGYRAGQSVTTGSDNIILGDHSVSCGEDLQSNILIGKNLISANCADYELILGYTDPLLYGKLGPTFDDRHLYLYKGAPLSFQNVEQNDLLTIRSKSEMGYAESWFEKVESLGKDHPEGTIDFLFTSKELDGSTAIMTEKKLLTLSHNAAAMTNSCSYQVSSPARPFAELQGDLNIRGTINFCDGTSLGSSDGLVYAPGNGINSSVNTDTGNTEFNLDIEELAFTGDLSGPDTHLAVSTNNLVRKVNIDGLAAIIASGEPRITECDSGAGQNHVFTNNSTIEDTTCYTNFFGSRAGDRASNTTASNFIGYQAGSHTVSVSANAVDNCSYSNFMGYKTGWETQNADHSVFIGSSAGYKADNSRVSVFIGDSAGTSASSERSIGIGDNALEQVTGNGNIEITVSTGGGGGSRIIGGSAGSPVSVSNALAIGTCIAGDMADKKVSLGDARIDPDAVLEVRAFLSTTDYLQEWKNSAGEVVARLTKEGNLYIKGSVTESYTSF